eukprot:3023612-Prymnesium_polylepis.1
MSELQACPSPVIVVVGHSNFFRRMFRACLHPSFKKRCPSLANTLCDSKIANCGVVCCELDFAQEQHVIVDVQHCWQPVSDNAARANILGTGNRRRVAPA